MSTTRHEAARIRAQQEHKLGECDPAHCEFCQADEVWEDDEGDYVDQEQKGAGGLKP